MRYHHGTVAATVITIGISLAVGAAPATAAPDPGPSVAEGSWGCHLERVGTQLVRCDDLTGGNVDAPTWIPERA